MKKYLSCLIIALGVICAAAMLYYETQHGIGVSSDGLTYFGTARNLLAGNGFYYRGYPLTHFPPGYSALIALTSIGNGNPIERARYLHIALFAINTGLVGLLVQKATNSSLVATTIAIVFFLSAWSLQEIHVMSYSEAPFTTCVLVVIGLCTRYIKHGRLSQLLPCTLIVSLAILLRYSGVVLLAPLVIIILYAQRNKKWLQRIIHPVIGIILSITPFVLWLARNQSVAENTTNRSISYHPVGWPKMKQLLNTLYDFWFPMNTMTRSSFQLGIQFVQVMFIVIIILFVIYQAIKYHLQSTDEINATSAAVLLFAGTFIIIYIPFLITSITYYDAVTPLDRRILSLWHIMLLIGMIVAFWHYAIQRNEKAIWVGFVAVISIFLAFNIDRGATFVVRRHLDGSGYSTYIWRFGLETIDTAVENGITVYTNAHLQADAIYVREVNRLPNEDTMIAVNDQIESGKAMLVYFQSAMTQQPSDQTIENAFESPPLFRNKYYTVYGSEEVRSMLSE